MRIRTFLKYARPKYLFANRRGLCAVCSKKTLFLLTDSPETVRNHALCVRCGSCSRHRHVAKCVLDAFRDRGIRRLSDFGNFPGIAVHDASSWGTLAKSLKGKPNFTCSEYFDGVPSGEYKDGVLCQDLCATSFASGSYDLIISEDVFEHIPDYPAAFREVHRVLKPGGYHIFSIPYHFDRKTRPLFEWKDGAPVLFEPVEYHGDPLRGSIPCYTYFGYDMVDLLEEMGFEVRIDISQFVDDRRIGTFDSFTLITRKIPNP